MTSSNRPGTVFTGELEVSLRKMTSLVLNLVITMVVVALLCHWTGALFQWNVVFGVWLATRTLHYYLEKTRPPKGTPDERL
jgi:hypothetical protein